MRSIWIVLALLGGAHCVEAASISKARTLYDQKLVVEAKKELIEVAYDEKATSADKAAALLLLGTINREQGDLELARKTWHELVERFPDSLEAKAVANQLSVDSKVAMEAQTERNPPDRPHEDSFRLLDQGQGPRYLLKYDADTIERVDVKIRMAMVEKDCPSEPAKEPYDEEVRHGPLTIKTAKDPESNFLIVEMMGKLHVSAHGERETTYWMHKEKITSQGQHVETLDGIETTTNLFQRVLPKVPVGIGARWEATETRTVYDSQTINTWTYTVTEISAKRAKIEVVMSNVGKSSFKGREALLRGGGNGVITWAAGHYMPPGTSLISFSRVFEKPKSDKEKPELRGCVLVSMTTK